MLFCSVKSSKRMWRPWRMTLQFSDLFVPHVRQNALELTQRKTKQAHEIYCVTIVKFTFIKLLHNANNIKEISK